MLILLCVITVVSSVSAAYAVFNLNHEYFKKLCAKLLIIILFLSNLYYIMVGAFVHCDSEVLMQFCSYFLYYSLCQCF